MNINRLKLKLGIDDTESDDLLEILLLDAANLICLYIESDELPSSLICVAEDLTVKRYRKLGSEGLTSESIDVISSSFESDPLAEYISILDKYRKSVKKMRLL